MKKPNNFITKSTIALCDASLLLSSCNGYFIESDMVESVTLSDEGESAIEISLTQEDRDYLDFLAKLAVDIMSNPKVAEDLANNPQQYVEKYGYYEKIDLDENLLHCVLTFADPEINEAIKQKDGNRLINLMISKGLLTNNYSKIHINEEQLNAICEKLGLNRIENTTESDSTSVNTDLGQKKSVANDEENVDAIVAVAAALFYIFGAVVEDLVVAYNVLGALNAAVYADLYAWVKVKGPSVATIQAKRNEAALESNLAFKAIKIKYPEASTYMLVEQYIDNFSDAIVEMIKKERPEVLKIGSEEAIKEFIKYNMYCQSINDKSNNTQKEND